MHLIEVVMAASVFAIASSSSLQLWSATAVGAHQLSRREQLEQQIEQDRLQLQILWRGSIQLHGDTSGCTASPAQLLTLASNSPVQTPLRRALQLSEDGAALQIHWSATSDPQLQRVRLVTPAGLGLCSPPPAEPQQAGDGSGSENPLSTNPVEGVTS
jgi:hypothetical protein